jgi:O-antigen ligase
LKSPDYLPNIGDPIIRRQPERGISSLILEKLLAISIEEWAFALFLVLVFVGISPFSVRAAEDLTQIVQATGEGDSSRQAAFLLSSGFITVLALRSKGLMIYKAFPYGASAILAWILISTSWSYVPDVTIRRAGLTALAATTVFFSVEMLGVEKALNVMRMVLAIVLIVDLASIPIIPQAKHLAGESDESLIGAWRGMHAQKNIAGQISTLGIFLFFHLVMENKRRSDMVFLAVSIIFTLGAFSKTALGFLLPVLTIGAFYKIGRTNIPVRNGLIWVFNSILILIAFLAYVFFDSIVKAIENPDFLTGRGAIWQVAIAFIADSPILGAGFRAFWDAGSASPLTHMATYEWLLIVVHSHNGYFELAVSSGLIGFTIGIIAFAVLPIRTLFSFRVPRGDLLIMWILITLLNNLTEATFLDRDNPQWIVFLFGLAMLHHAKRGWYKPDTNGRFRRVINIGPQGLSP